MHIAGTDLESITDNVWNTMLGLPVMPACEAAAIDDAPGTLAGSIDIDGAWRGGVTLTCPRGLAQLIARVIFGLDAADAPEPTPTQMADALAELTNMTGGNLKALLPESCVLSLPQVSLAAAAPRHAGVMVAEASFECAGQPFVVRVYEEPVHAEATGTVA